METILKGSKIYLNRLCRDDLQKLMTWQLKESLMRNYEALPLNPKSEDALQSWIEESSPDAYRFAIREVQQGELIGYAAVEGILWTHRTGWVSILIGEEKYHGLGYGTEAMERVMHFAFRELNLHRLQLSVFSYNKNAISLYEKLGFTKEGTYREFLERDMKRHDMHLYGLLRHEWQMKTRGETQI